MEVERASSSLMTANATVQSLSLERDRLNAKVMALRPDGESLTKTQEELEAERGRVAELSDQLHSSEERHAAELENLCNSVQREVVAAVREYCRSD